MFCHKTGIVLDISCVTDYLHKWQTGDYVWTPPSPEWRVRGVGLGRSGSKWWRGTNIIQIVKKRGLRREGVSLHKGTPTWEHLWEIPRVLRALPLVLQLWNDQHSISSNLKIGSAFKRLWKMEKGGCGGGGLGLLKLKFGPVIDQLPRKLTWKHSSLEIVGNFGGQK